MIDPIHRSSRREFVAGLGALASLPLLIAACGDDDAGGAPSAAGRAPAGPWSFKDDRGKTIELDKAPERMVMHEYATIALWDYGFRPVGIYGSIAIADQPLFDGLDVEGIEQVGRAWGEINLEGVAALGPDAIITTWWPGDALLGGVKDAKIEAKLEAIAPIVGIHAQVPATTTIEHFEKLAVSLGADPDAPAITAERERFETAKAALQRAAAEKAGLKTMAVYVDPELLYIGKVPDYADLRDYESWGMRFVSGKSKDPYWQKVSWENADGFEADLIMLDARAGAPSVEDLADLPVWRDLPAVQAGQITPWHMEEDVSYRVFADHIEELTASVAKAELVT
jgi:iron complex transport system substrate-binding protein